MAYTRRKTSRSAPRRAAPKRSPARRAPARRKTSARRASARQQTIKIVIEQSPAQSGQNSSLRDLGLPQSPASVRKSRF
jgi:Flp pilus assembly protein TadB